MKFFNISSHGGYSPVPELSPYSNLDAERLANPKFIFRYADDLIRNHYTDRELENLSLMDVVCAN